MVRKFRIATASLLCAALSFSFSASAEENQPRAIVTGWIPYY